MDNLDTILEIVNCYQAVEIIANLIVSFFSEFRKYI